MPITPRKIVFFLSSMTCGGAERVALLLSEAMTDLGCRIYLVLARREGAYLAEVSERVDVISLDCGKPIRGTRELGELIRKLNPDAVLSFGVHAGIAAAISKVRTGFRQPLFVRNESNIEVEWQLERFHNRLLGPMISRWMARRATVICVSRSLQLPTANFLRMRPGEVKVIMNPVFPLSAASSAGSEIHPWLATKKCPTFVAIGRLEIQKDFRTLLGAFRKVVDKVPCRLIIFGEGSQREDLHELRDSLGLSEQVDFPGFTATPALQLQQASGFVLSSRWEGFGLVLVEALAAGTAVISTRCDFGPFEILEGGRYGALVPTGDDQALAKAMLDVANGEHAGASPAAEWYRQFDAAVAARRHLEIVNEVIAG